MTADPSAARFASALSTLPDSRAAIDDVCRRALAALDGPADLAMLFVSASHAAAYDDLPAWAAEQLGDALLLGCTGESIVGVGQEVENEPAISLWLARLPGVRRWPLRLEFERTPEGGTIVGWPDDLPEPWPEKAALLLLADPFTFPADSLLERLNEDQPGVPVVGGMASAAHEPGENRLFFNGQAHAEGAVGILFDGGLSLRTVVSQGCRPIGKPYVITKAERNIIIEIGGRPPLVVLQEIFDQASPEEKPLMQRGMHVGRVVDPYCETFRQGDFLIRNVIGVDRATGAVAIGDYVRPGQTVQFHIRDAASADEELKHLLGDVGLSAGATGSASGATGGLPASAALLFTCNGRGTRLFDTPHHDAGCISTSLGPIPLAGFFAAGELGPIGGKNFLHGFTASVAIFG